MVGKFKAGIATGLATAMCLAAVSASASTWVIKDYDTSSSTPLPTAPIVYQEFDDNGFPTGRVVSGLSAQAENLKGFADVELKNSWISDVYPNAEYANLYADGNYTGRVFATGRDGSVPGLVQYRDVDYMWEAAAPYKIYSIKQANLLINGKAQWFGTVEKNYPVQYTGRNASVTSERVAYGFADYEVTGTNKVSTVPSVIKSSYMDKTAYTALVGLTSDQLAPSTLPTKTVEVAKDATILIPRTYDLKLTGPSFDDNGVQTAGGKVIYGTKESNPSKFNVSNLLTTITDVSGNLAYCDITWTKGAYEKAKPYRLYEYLTIDGVVMDGSAIGNGLYKPSIFRYTGAKANLDHKIAVVGVSEDGEVLLQTKVTFDEGKTYVAEGDAYGSGVYANASYRVEKGTAVNGAKTVTPVYAFEFNGVKYDTYEVNGQWFVEEWGNNTVATNAPHYFLEPYVK
jgi:hypothetical protein